MQGPKFDAILLQGLLNIGENVNMQDKNLSTPLMHAAAHGSITIVKELLDRGIVSHSFHKFYKALICCGLVNLKATKDCRNYKMEHCFPRSLFRSPIKKEEKKYGTPEMM